MKQSSSRSRRLQKIEIILLPLKSTRSLLYLAWIARSWSFNLGRWLISELNRHESQDGWRDGRSVFQHTHIITRAAQAVGKLFSCLKLSVVLQIFAEANIVMAATKLTIQQNSSEQYLLSTPAWIIPGIDFSIAQLNQLKMALLAANTIVWVNVTTLQRFMGVTGVSCYTDCNDNVMDSASSRKSRTPLKCPVLRKLN